MMGIRCEVNKDQNIQKNDNDTMGIRCEENKDLNTRGNDEI